LRQADTIARLGGDEFVVLLPRTSIEGAVIAAERMHAALAEPVDLGNCQRPLTVSVGIAVYPLHSVEAGALIDCADAAMYAANTSGARFAVFNTEVVNESVP